MMMMDGERCSFCDEVIIDESDHDVVCLMLDCVRDNELIIRLGSDCTCPRCDNTCTICGFDLAVQYGVDGAAVIQTCTLCDTLPSETTLVSMFGA